MGMTDGGMGMTSEPAFMKTGGGTCLTGEGILIIVIFLILPY
jgi:hypothetical protein